MTIDDILIGHKADDPEMTYNIAIGVGASVGGRGAIAFGAFSEAIGEGAMAVGFKARALGKGAVAIGDNTRAIGAGAKQVSAEFSEEHIKALREMIQKALLGVSVP